MCMYRFCWLSVRSKYPFALLLVWIWGRWKKLDSKNLYYGVPQAPLTQHKLAGFLPTFLLCLNNTSEEGTQNIISPLPQPLHIQNPRACHHAPHFKASSLNLTMLNKYRTPVPSTLWSIWMWCQLQSKESTYYASVSFNFLNLGLQVSAWKY